MAVNEIAKKYGFIKVLRFLSGKSQDW